MQKIQDQMVADVLQPAAIHANKRFDRNVRQIRANPFKRSRNAALHQRASFGKIEAKNPIRLAGPVLLRVMGEQLARLEADTKIIDSEKYCMGMGNIDSNQWNAGAGNFISDDGGYILIHLKFNDEIHSVANKFIRVPYGNRRVILVVENQ